VRGRARRLCQGSFVSSGMSRSRRRLRGHAPRRCSSSASRAAWSAVGSGSAEFSGCGSSWVGADSDQVWRWPFGSVDIAAACSARTLASTESLYRRRCNTAVTPLCRWYPRSGIHHSQMPVSDGRHRRATRLAVRSTNTHRRSPVPACVESPGQYPRELIKAPMPSLILGVAALVGRDAAVDHQHGGRALGLGEGEFVQLLVGGVVVECPGHD
jgi:hypothetical protein